MQTVDKLEVYYAGKHVGTMAPFRKYLTAFEYSDALCRLPPVLKQQSMIRLMACLAFLRTLCRMDGTVFL